MPRPAYMAKPNTKNAIIQFVDSKSVELAFKSKSDIGTSEESLKISPLKQKKTSAQREDPIDDLASMMMQMQMLNQAIDTPQPARMAPQKKGLQFGNPATNTYCDYDECYPQVARRHRKSSSVDVFTSSKPSSSYAHHQVYGGIAHQHFMPGSQATHQAAQQNTFKMSGQPKMDLPMMTPGPVDETGEPEDEDRFSTKTNFVTLIDLFGDDDNLSASFYGVHPMKRSKMAASTTKSRRAIGDSSSECPEEDLEHSARLSD